MSTLLSGKPPPPSRALHFCGVRYFLPALAAGSFLAAFPDGKLSSPRRAPSFSRSGSFLPLPRKKKGSIKCATRNATRSTPNPLPPLPDREGESPKGKSPFPPAPRDHRQKGTFSGKINGTILRIVSSAPRGPDPAGREFSLYRAFKKTQKILLYFYFPID